jgi:predicted N-formylglutamate amidohydrolase
MLPLRETTASLLGRSEPDPVEIANPDGDSIFLLVCEHAGRAVPSALGDLGIAAAEMDRHIAYDIGAEGLARRLSVLLDAPLVLQRYSRLVVDCNRPFEAADCFPEISDGTAIPCNRGVARAERMRRFDEIHRPFHGAIAGLLDRRQSDMRTVILAAIHSFTPRLGGRKRPWQIGICVNRDDSFAQHFTDAFVRANPAIRAARNEPYPVDDFSDYTIPVHGEGRKLPHVLIEVRNDQIIGSDGQERWAALIAESLKATAAAYAGKERAHGA